MIIVQWHRNLLRLPGSNIKCIIVLILKLATYVMVAILIGRRFLFVFKGRVIFQLYLQASVIFNLSIGLKVPSY